MNTNVACTIVLAFIGIVFIQGCPQGWKEYRGMCYLFVEKMYNYNDALKFCQSKGAFLAEPRTKEENDFIASKLKGRTFIGYNDRAHENNFVGDYAKTPLTYSNWWKGEPNNLGNEDCVEMGFSKTGNTKWNDIHCRTAGHLVCELKGCPNGWQRFKHKCYLVNGRKCNFKQAMEYCHGANGYLAEPRTKEENEFIAKLTRKQVSFIGYNDKAKEGHFVGEYTNIPMSYNNWNKREPNNVGNEDCVEIRSDAAWNDIGCTASRPFICEIESCPYGWRGFKDKCFLFVNTKRTYQNAKNYCQSLNGHLAEPRNDEENSFIAKTIDERTFIGYNDLTRESHFVGVHTPLTYHKWYRNEPNNLRNEDCVEIGFPHKGDTTWNDIPCRLARQSVCELNRCPWGWWSFGHKCLLFEKTKRTYQDAKNYCQNVNGYLVEIRTDEENSFIAKMMNERAFIGYYDRKKGTHFVGVHTQAPLTYHKWYQHEPTGNEGCVEIGFPHKGATTWNDIPCTLPRSFVCELNRCPYGWRRLKDKCFLPVTTKRKYQDAENYCKSVRGFLAEPRTMEENSFIAKIINNKAFIGYNDRIKENHFVGVHTQKPLTYHNWYQNEPNNLRNEDCVEIGFPNKGDTAWNDIPCTLARQSVCELNPTFCPDNWKPYGNNCYFLSHGRASWLEARMVCQSMGANLAEPKDKGQNDFLASLSHERLWIGLNDVVKERTFVWDSNQNHLGLFHPWDYKQPDNYKGYEDCVETNHVGHLGKWNDSPCGKYFRYVCQKDHY